MKHPVMRASTLLKTVAVLLLVSSLTPSAAQAGSVTVEGTASQIVVTAQDASLEEVLGELGRAQGFEVERASGEPGAALSGRFTGPISDVLVTILQNESYLIEHAPAATAGIARIVLLGSAGKTGAASPDAPAQAANTAAAAQGPRPLPREVIPPSAPVASTPVAPLRQVAKRART